MPAVQETIERVRNIDIDQYKYGFVTDIESDKAPKGLSEDTVRFISAKKNEPAWMLEWRLDAYRRWLTMTRAEMGARRLSQDRLPGPLLLFCAEATRRRRRSTRSTPRSSRPTPSSAFRCASRRCWPASSTRTARARACGRCSVRFGLGRHHLPEGARQGRRPLLLDLRGAAEAAGAGEEVSRHGRADHRQFLSPRSTRRCSPTARSSTCRRACAARWSCRPTSASTRRTPASSSARSSSPTRAPT